MGRLRSRTMAWAVAGIVTVAVLFGSWALYGSPGTHTSIGPLKVVDSVNFTVTRVASLHPQYYSADGYFPRTVISASSSPDLVVINREFNNKITSYQRSYWSWVVNTVHLSHPGSPRPSDEQLTRNGFFHLITDPKLLFGNRAVVSFLATGVTAIEDGTAGYDQTSLTISRSTGRAISLWPTLFINSSSNMNFVIREVNQFTQQLINSSNYYRNCGLYVDDSTQGREATAQYLSGTDDGTGQSGLSLARAGVAFTITGCFTNGGCGCGSVTVVIPYKVLWGHLTATGRTLISGGEV